eukprot:COSAG05_NODE_147_length_16383_cov_266.102555_10_plen_87_part_00
MNGWCRYELVGRKTRELLTLEYELAFELLERLELAAAKVLHCMHRRTLLFVCLFVCLPCLFILLEFLRNVPFVSSFVSSVCARSLF